MIRSGDDFQGVTMSDDDVKKELERLRNENAALKKGAATGITMKVSEKGGLSVYGMGRFPITLYKEQWLKLLDMSDAIRAFIAANEATLKAARRLALEYSLCHTIRAACGIRTGMHCHPASTAASTGASRR